MKKTAVWLCAWCALMMVLWNPSASAATPDNGSCGENVGWTLTADGTLTIRGRGAMDDYNRNATPWITRKHGREIFRIQIEYGVTRIGTYAFYGLPYLTDVIIAGSVNRIGEAAFNGCENLVEISMEEGVSRIEKNAFNTCKALDTLTLPDSLTTIEQGAFAYCENLREIDIPSGVSTLETYAFRNCLSLTRAGLPDTLTTIGSRAFSNCEELSDITLPRRVSSIGPYAFENCAALRNIEIPASMTVIAQGTFYNSGLQTVSLPNGVTEIETLAFGRCYDLSDVYYAASETRWNAIPMNEFRALIGEQNVQVHFGEGGQAQMPARIRTLTISSGRVSAQIEGIVEENSTLILAAYDSNGKMLDIGSYPVYQAGQYTDYLSTSGAKNVTAFLIGPDGRPIADALNAPAA